jgi:ribosomal protein L34E
MLQCARCTAPFSCGMQDQQPCWCATLPPFMPAPPAGGGCYCPQCLNEMLVLAQAGLTQADSTQAAATQSGSAQSGPT